MHVALVQKNGICQALVVGTINQSINHNASDHKFVGCICSCHADIVREVIRLL